MNAPIRPGVRKHTHGLVRVEVNGADGAKPGPNDSAAGTLILPTAGVARASVVLVGGHEGGADVDVEPSIEREALFRAASARRDLKTTVEQALESNDLPVCVVPMTLGRDPGLVADTARALMAVTDGAAGGRLVLADPFGTATLLTGWLRVAVAQAAGSPCSPDLAVVLTANAANKFDDAELCRIAHLVKVQARLSWVEVAFRDGDPAPAEVVERCETLGARRIALVPADFRSVGGPPASGVINGEPLLSSATVSGVLATRTAAALLKLSRGDDGIAAGLNA
ncbi:sirohydrochlorin cobaltochelatase [Catenulispora sp. MAP5-51]